ncbi:MAG: LysR family transcriptional regulator [Minwuia sp.]|nr:LysR family transcriptional regulator [Minwuia sp.]
MADQGRLNLNLLRIFVTVYETGHVTQAAEQLGMSQPAVSAGLSRLARHFGQPLFERVSNGVAPTVAADKLIDPIREGLHAFETGLDTGSHAIPEQRKRNFRISVPNFGEPTIFVPVLDQMWREMPGVTVEIVPFFRVNLEEEMFSGALDLAYNVGAFEHDVLRHQYLVDGRWVCITRRGWSADFGPLTRDAFARASRVQLDGDHVQVEAPVIYNPDGPYAVPTCRLNRGWSVPHIVANSDMVAVVPLAFAIFFKNRFGLDLHPPPIAAPPSDVVMVWHPRSDNDPLHRRLREMCLHSIQELTRRIRTGQKFDETLFQDYWDDEGNMNITPDASPIPAPKDDG